MITQTDRIRGARQALGPPRVNWLIPGAFLALALGRVAQIRSLAVRFDVRTSDVVALFRLTESARIGRVFRGYEVAIIVHTISVGVLLAFAGLQVFILWTWRVNSRTQRRLWNHVEELESRQSHD
jgi:hypothetical protein